MVEFILGFCLAIVIIMILSKQKAIHDLEQSQRESAESLSRMERIHQDKLLEQIRIRLHLSDISNTLSELLKPKKKHLTRK